MENVTEPDFSYIANNLPNQIALAAAQILKFYVPILFLILGIPGNVLSFIILSTPQFRHATTSFYMRLLAVSDTGFLLSRVVQRLLLNWFLKRLLTSVGALFPFCIEYLFTKEVTRVFSMYILVTMTLDRVVALSFPLKAKQWLTFKAATIVASVIALISIIDGIPIFFSTYSEAYKHWLCPYYLQGEALQIDILVSNVATSVCCILLFLSNIVIIVQLYRSARMRTKMEGAQNSDRDKESSAKNKQITTMLLTVSCVFLLTNIPREFDIQFWPNVSKEIQANSGFRVLSLEIYLLAEYFAYATNFYFYVISCPKFYAVLKEMICRRRNKNVSSLGDKTSQTNLSSGSA